MGLCYSRAWPTCVEKGTPITSATVQAVLDAGSPMAAMPGGRRVCQATVVQATGEQGNGKRKRRPPGWLEGHAQGDTDNSGQMGEGGAAAGGALLSPHPTQLILDSKRGKRSPAVNVVHATMVDSRHASAAGGAGYSGGGAQYAVTILGITSQSVIEARHKAERSPTTPNPSSAERSPRMRASELKKTNSFQEDDAFEVDFGALAPPRMIEVVKPKEVLLPSWRIVKAGSRRRAAADAGDSSDEDTSDAVFLLRHNRALKRAVAEAAAKEAAAETAHARPRS